MAAAPRTSPLWDILQSCEPRWGLAENMQYARSILGEATHVAQLGLADLSHRARFGVKGAQAASWLAAQDIATPTQPNTWLSLGPDTGSFVARLGLTEFLIEGSAATSLQPWTEAPAPSVYPVVREDTEIALLGPQVNELLRQTCNVNFLALDISAHPVVLTSMVGITVTILPGSVRDTPYYRLWCDYSFGAYLWQTLLEIARELGGGPIGADLCPEPPINPDRRRP